MAYHQFKTEEDDGFGSFETFYQPAKDEATVNLVVRGAWSNIEHEDGTPYAPGWYWQACYPGCIPDGEPSGPFETEQAAIDDANDFD